jgi:hypothetical protein
VAYAQWHATAASTITFTNVANTSQSSVYHYSTSGPKARVSPYQSAHVYIDSPGGTFVYASTTCQG